MWSALSSTSIELADNGGFRVEFCDVRNLTGDTLMFCGYTAIGINHETTSKIVLKLTKVSFNAYIMSCFCEKGSCF